MIEYRTIQCDSLIRRITHRDPLFQGGYCIDPYQNCEFQCTYCDSSFDPKIYVKINAVEILKQELPSLEKKRIIIGSVHDPYQNAEKKYELTKNILQVLREYQFPCHILTKSPLILRDIPLLETMDCLVTISFISIQEKIRMLFEPNIASSQERLDVLQTLTAHHIPVGAALIPILPYISDTELSSLLEKFKQYGAQYVLHSFLELKGDQKEKVFTIITKHFPHLTQKYKNLYAKAMKPTGSYIQHITKQIHNYCLTFDIPEYIE
ncbi:MAG: radical SAM protein [Candidatus Thermoplasmatota archaeon]